MELVAGCGDVIQPLRGHYERGILVEGLVVAEQVIKRSTGDQRRLRRSEAKANAGVGRSLTHTRWGGKGGVEGEGG